MIQSLDLKPKEGLYLETLVDIQKAKSIEEKEIYAARLKSLYPKKHIKIVEVEDHKASSDPLHPVITELALRKDFQADANWIQKKLIWQTSLAEIEQALERLIGLGLLQENNNGSITKGERHIKSGGDRKNLALQKYHKKVCALAAEQVEKQDVSEREYIASIMPIKKEKLNEAKDKLRDFIDEFIYEFEDADASPESSIHCLQLNLFKLTKSEKGE